MSAEHKKFISTKEASSIVGRTSDYVGRLAREGKIPASRIGRSWVVEKKALLEFFDIKEAVKEIKRESLSKERKIEYKKVQAPKAQDDFKNIFAKSFDKLPFENAAALALTVLIVFGGYSLAGATGISSLPFKLISAVHERASDVHRVLARSERHPELARVNYVVAQNKVSNEIKFEANNIFATGFAEVESFGNRFKYTGVQKSFASTYVPGRSLMLPSSTDIWNGYKALGEGLVVAAHGSVDAYTGFVKYLGKESLSNALAVQNIAQAASANILNSYEEGLGAFAVLAQELPKAQAELVYGFVDGSFVLANTLASVPYNTGGAILTSAQSIPEANIKIGSSVRENSPKLGRAIIGGYVDFIYSFVDSTYALTDTYKDAIESTGDTIGTGYAYARFDLPTTILAGANSGLDVSTEKVMGMIKFAGERIAANVFVPAVETVMAVPENIGSKLAGVKSPLATNTAEKVEEAQANVIGGVAGGVRDIFDRIFGRKKDPVLLVNPGPAQTNVVIKEDEPAAPVYIAPRNVTQNFFASTDVNKLYVDSSITALHAALSAEIQKLTAVNRNQIVQNIETIQWVNKIEDISGTIIRDGEFLSGIIRNSEITGSTFRGSSVNANTGTFDTLNAATTTLTGPLTIPTLIASGTTTLATTTLTGPLTGTTATLASATTTNFFAINASTTNATSTNLFANNASTTNATSTNFFSNNSVVTNATSTNFYTTALEAITATLTNLTATNATTTNATTTNLTISSLTAGSIPFIGTGGLVVEDNSNLFFDNGNDRLGIGTTTPGYLLDVDGDFRVGEAGSSNALFVDATNAQVGINTNSPGQALGVDGNIATLSSGNFIGFSSNSAYIPRDSALRAGVNAPGSFYFNIDSNNDETTSAFIVAKDSASLAGGTELFRVQEDGSVGIGTTSPYAKLSVVGQAVAEYFTATSTSVASTFPELTSTNATTTGTFSAASGGSQASGLTVLANGYVGINDTTPESPLDVTVSASKPAIFRATTEPRVRLVAGGSNVGLLNGYIGDSFRVYSSSGLPLHIGYNETTQFQFSSGQVDSSVAIIPTSNATYDLGSPAYYWDDAYFDSATINNLSAASTSIAGTNNASFSINSDNATSDGEDASLVFYRGVVVPNAVIGWDASEDRFDFNQNIFIQNDNGSTGTSTLAVRAASSQTGNLFTVQDNNGLELANFDINGYLGLGSSSPSVRLTVGTGTPSSIAAADYYNSAYISGDLEVDGSLYGTIAPAGFTEGSVVFANSSGALAQDNSNFFWNDSTNRLGIGTTTPASALVIEGSGSATHLDVVSSANSGVRIESAGVANYPFLQFAQGSTDQYELGVTATTDAAGGDVFYINPSPNSGATGAALVVDGSGNVGIGTTTPATTVDIYATDAIRIPVGTTAQRPSTELTGQIRYNTNTTQYEGYNGSNWLGLGGVIDIDQDTYVTAEESSDEDYLRLYTAGTERVTIDDSGNVGIGTTSPNYNLSVTGSTGINFEGTGVGAISRFSRGTGTSNAPRPVTEFVANSSVDAADDFGSAIEFQISDTGVTNSQLGAIGFVRDGGDGLGKFFIGQDSQLTDFDFVVDASGNVGVGSTSPDQKFVVQGGNIKLGTNNYSLQGVTTAGAALNLIRFNSSDQLGLYNDNHIFTSAQYLGKDGSASLPSVSFASDPNTGIYTSAGDKLDIALGGTQRAQFGTGGLLNLFVDDARGLSIVNGSTAIGILDRNGTAGELLLRDGSSSKILFSGASGVDNYINNGGSLGIGTTSPDHEIEVVNTSGGAEISIITNAASEAQLIFGDDSSDWMGRILYANASDSLSLYTNASEQVRIDSSGNVGIGTTSPESALHVARDSAADQLRLGRTDDPSYLSIGAGASNAVYNMVGGATVAHQFQEDGSALLTIESSGDVGIGTTSPDTALQVIGTITAGDYGTQGYLEFVDDGGETGQITQAGNTFALTARSDGSGGQFVFNNGSTELVRILSSGNVGIGTTSPTTKLHVDAGTSNNVLTLESSDANADLSLVDNTTTSSGVVGLRAAGDDLFLRAGGASVLTAKDGGNIGIGITDPQNLLHLGGSDAVKIQFTRSNGETSSDGTLLSLASDGQFNLDNQETAGFGWYIGGSNVVTLDSAGEFGIGTESPNAQLAVKASGGGITGGIYLENSANTNQLIQLYQDSSDSAGVLEIQTNAGADAIKLDGNGYSFLSGGNVGIGTTTPGSNLVIADSTEARIDLDITDETSFSQIRFQEDLSNVARIQYNGSSLSTANRQSALELINTSASGAVIVRTDDTERLRVDGSGNVGFGTTTPRRKVHIAENNPAFILEDTSGASAGYKLMRFNYTGGTGDTDSSFNVQSADDIGAFIANLFTVTRDGTVGVNGDNTPDFTLEVSDNHEDGYFGISSNTSNDGDIFIVDNSGNVGIGTSSPVSLFAVEGGAYFANTINSAKSGYLLKHTSGNTGLRYVSPNLQAYNDGNLGWSIDASGNVGIGEAGPGAKLDIVDTATTGTGLIVQKDLAASRFTTNVESQFSIRGNTDDTERLLIGYATDENYGYIEAVDQGGTFNRDLVLNSQGGSVGIGTTTPVHKFVVQGGTISGDAAGHFLAGNGGATVGLIVDGDADSTDVLFKARSNGSATPTDSDTKFIITGDGNVGIGTTSPGYLLDVDGDFNVGEAGNAQAFYVDATAGRVAVGENAHSLTNLDGKGIIITNTAGGATGRLRLDVEDISSGYNTEIRANDTGLEFEAASNSRNISLWTGATPEERLTVLGTGNVGINDSTPDAQLDVVSASTIIAQFEGPSAGGDIRIARGSSYQYDIGLTGSSVFYIEDASGNTPFQIEPATPSNTLYVDSAGYVGIGTSTPTSKLTVTGDIEFGDPSYQTYRLGNTANIGATTYGRFVVQSQQAGTHSSLWMFTNDGDGTDNNKISLFGVGSPADNTNLESLGVGYQASEQAYQIRTSAGGTGVIRPLYLAADSTSNQLYLATTSNVGIGTSSPQSLLHVYKDTATGVSIDVGSDTSYAQFDFKNEDVYKWAVGNLGDTHSAGNNLFYIYQSNDSSDSAVNEYRLVIDDSGNVGIGTTTPNNVLNINGSTSISDGNSLIVGHDYAQTIAYADFGVQVLGTEYSDSGATLGRWSNNAGGTNIAFFKSRGTTVGSNSIVQDGDTIGNFFASVDDGVDYDSVAAGIRFQVDGTPGAGDTPGRIVFLTTADGANTLTERVRIDDAGNVGIGSDSPSATQRLLVEYTPTGTFTEAANTAYNHLTVRGNNNGYAGFTIASPNSGAELGAIAFADEKHASAGLITYSHVTNDLIFYASTTERLYIDGEEGNIGVGDTTPNARLEIEGANRLGATFENATFGEGVLVTQTDYSAGNYISLIEGMYTADYSAPSVRIGAMFDGSGSNLAFGTSNSYSGGITNTALSIDSSGNVGVGTTSPDALLHAEIGGAGDIFKLQRSDVASDFSIDFAGGLTNFAISAGSEYTFSEGGAEHVRIDASGNVGIGTSSPASLLTVSKGGSNGVIQEIFTLDAGTQNLGVAGSGTVIGFDYLTTASAGGVGAYGDGTNPGIGIWGGTISGDPELYVNDAGNVGIGTTSPLGTVHVASAGSGQVSPNNSADDLIIENSAAAGISILTPNTAVGHLFFGDSDNATRGRLSYNHADNDISLWTNSTERLTIDSSGNVGIGETVPETKLEVSGGNILLTNNQSLQFEDTGGANRSLVTLDSSDLQTFGTVNNNATFQGFDVGFNAARSAGGTTDEAFLFTATNNLGVNDEVFQVADGGGNLLTVLGTGNVGIGTASPDSIKLDVEDDIEIGTGTTGCVRDADNTTLTGTCVSDERLKKNIQDLDPVLDRLAQLRGVTFEWRNDEFEWLNGQAGTNYGLIAQEVEAVFPEMVQEDDRGYKRVSYDTAFTTRLLQGIIELDEKLESRIGANGAIAIDALGNIGIGTTTPAYKLHVLGDAAATSFVNISTREEKKGIAYLDEARKDDILSKLKAVQIAEYRYNFESDDNPLRLGLIAEEAPSEVLSVSGKGVDIYKLATFTLASVQEIALKLETLEERIAALEASGVVAGSGGVFSTTTLKSAFAELGVLIEKGFAQFDALAFKQLIAQKDNDGEAAAGTGTIYAGNKLVLVENSQIKASSKVFITFTSPVVGSWFITDKANGSFRVTLDQVQNTDVTFDYFIVQTERDQAPVSDTGVVDTEEPVITIIGANPYYIATGTAYVEPGVTITDNVDQNLTYTLSVDGYSAETHPLDTSVAGEHVLTYKVLDTAGNLTTATRSVVVGADASLTSLNTGTSTEETTATITPAVVEETPVVEEEVVVEEAPVDEIAPVISLVGAAAIEITVGDSFTDEGATAADDIDGDITANIVVTGAVDTENAGLYTLTYTATDIAGNEASVSRIVTVVAVETPEAPVEDVVE